MRPPIRLTYSAIANPNVIRLGVPAVGAADLRRVGLGLGERDEPRGEHAEPRQRDLLDRAAVAERVRGVDDVVRGRAEVHVARVLVLELAADDVHERAHVVAGALLLLGDRGGVDARATWAIRPAIASSINPASARARARVPSTSTLVLERPNISERYRLERPQNWSPPM